MKKLSQFLILLLMLDAAWVTVCQSFRWNAWGWIIAYWAILTVKNAVDYIGSKKKG